MNISKENLWTIHIAPTILMQLCRCRLTNPRYISISFVKTREFIRVYIGIIFVFVEIRIFTIENYE